MKNCVNWNVMCSQGRKEETEGAERLWPGGSNLVNCRELERNREEKRNRG